MSAKILSKEFDVYFQTLIETKSNPLQSRVRLTLFNCAQLTPENSTDYWSDVLSGCVMCVNSTSN